VRVLVVESGLADDGAMRVTLDRAAAWARAGVDVRVAVLSHHDEGRPARIPTGLRVLHATPGPERLRRRLLPTVRLLLGEARRADVVVAGREVGDGLLGAAVAARLTRTPLAVTAQSSVRRAVEHTVPSRLQALTWRLLRGADLLVAVSDGVGEELRRDGVPAARVRVVPNGIDVPRLRSAAEPAPQPPLPDGRLVVAAGRLTHVKGFDVLIAAHARALAAGAPAHQVVVLGEGEDHDALLAQARELGVAGTVHLVGFRQDAAAIYARADVVTVTSRWEGFSLVLAEALSLGTPVIATDCPYGPAHVLRGGRDGRLVPVDDADALAAALVDALTEPDGLRAKARAAAADAGDRFSAEASARAHLEALTTLV